VGIFAIRKALHEVEGLVLRIHSFTKLVVLEITTQFGGVFMEKESGIRWLS